MLIILNFSPCFYINVSFRRTVIILPRQARDRHRGETHLKIDEHRPFVQALELRYGGCHVASDAAAAAAAAGSIRSTRSITLRDVKQAGRDEWLSCYPRALRTY